MKKELNARERYLASMDAEKVLTHKMRCPVCGEQIEFNEDDILIEDDWTEATGVIVRSLRCPWCWTRNIVSMTNERGEKSTYIDVVKLSRPIPVTCGNLNRRKAGRRSQ